jgi:hypothetical protein
MTNLEDKSRTHYLKLQGMNGKHETFQYNIVKLDEAEAQVRIFFQDS